MNVLESIIEGVLLDEANRRLSEAQLQELLENVPQVRDVRVEFAKSDLSLIAEVKRSSPSRGAIAEISKPEDLAKSYERSGASVISVLTEQRRFQGSLSDFIAVRNSVGIPLLRKDFIVSDYLVRESRAYGTDLLLLIVAALDDKQLMDFYQLAKELGMEVLVEVHNEHELERALSLSPSIVGVNSRNLKTLEIDISNFTRLLPMIPDSIIKVAESGINSAEDVRLAREGGANVILVGEALVRSSDPAKLIDEFLASGRR